jgi:hypothetical protein
MATVLDERTIASEVIALFKIVGICLAITLVGCVVLYYTGPTQGAMENDIPYDEWLHRLRMGRVENGWSGILTWSLIILIGGRYLLALLQWAQKTNKD